MKRFQGYAPPNLWSGWQTIHDVVGIRTFNVSYTVVGETLVYAKIRYPAVIGRAKREIEFVDQVTLTTAEVYDTIDICFKGVPLGSAVQGEVG